MRRRCQRCKRSRGWKAWRDAPPKARICDDCRKKGNRTRRNKARDYNRERHLLETYGLTLAEYDLLFEKQGGVCGICGGERRYNLHVDHDHTAEAAYLERGYSPQEAARRSVRGLLCKTCNKRLLPAAKDNIDTLRAAIEYLVYPPAEEVLDADEPA